MSQQLTPIPTMTDSELRKELANQTELIELAEAALAIHKAAKHFVQAELDRRELERYWQAHPELLRLEAGDKLALTDEARSEIGTDERNWNVYQTAMFLYSKEFTVDQIDTESGYVLVQYTPASRTSFPIAIVSNMRKAYLAQQGETT